MTKLFVVATSENKFETQGFSVPAFQIDSAASLPNLPKEAIAVCVETGYLFKHNTRISCPRGRELKKELIEGPKQSHEKLLAWLMPGEEIRYTISGIVGSERTFKRGVWRYDGQNLTHEVLEAEGESGPHSDRYLVHGKTGVRAVIPVNAEVEQQLAIWEAAVKAARQHDKQRSGPSKFEQAMAKSKPTHAKPAASAQTPQSQLDALRNRFAK